MKLKVGDIVRAYGMPQGPEWDGATWIGIITAVRAGILVHWINEGSVGITSDEYYEAHDSIFLHDKHIS